MAAGAWTWEGPGGLLFVLVDVQSAIPDLVQGRLDLWAVAGDSVSGVGRSEVMVSAAEFGAFVFDDLTGDGLPDLLGYVADSAGTSYPVFVPGATGTMNEELEQAAPRYRFSADPLEAPSAVAGCALRLWAEEPVPDGAAAGWRFLALRAGGALGRPSVATPTCAAEAPQ